MGGGIVLRQAHRRNWSSACLPDCSAFAVPTSSPCESLSTSQTACQPEARGQPAMNQPHRRMSRLPRGSYCRGREASRHHGPCVAAENDNAGNGFPPSWRLPRLIGFHGGRGESNPRKISIDRYYSPGVTRGGVPASSIARSAAVVTVKRRIRPHRRHTICRPGPVVPSAGVHLCLKRTQRTLRLMPPPSSHPYIGHQTTLQAMGWKA
jgi:hypothetical protein